MTQFFDLQWKDKKFSIISDDNVYIKITGDKSIDVEDFSSVKEWADKHKIELRTLDLMGWGHVYRDFTEEQLLSIINGSLGTPEQIAGAQNELDIKLKKIKREKVKSENKEKRKNISGYVYILKADNGIYKIGRTINLDNRIFDIGIKVPMKIDLYHSFISSDYINAEKILHEKFSDKRDHGEWFHLTKNDLTYISGIGDNSI
jgi:hypothetical protein